MKKLVIAFALCMCALCLYAQDAARNRGVIAVYQYFHGWTHCHWDGKPSFGSCNITSDEAQISCNLTSSKDKDTIAVAQMFASKSGVIYLDKEKTKKLSLKIVHYADHIDNNKSEYTIDTLHVGFNRSEEYNKTDHCIGTKDEGYEVSTTVIVDNPVEIISNEDNSSLSIDDNEKCELLLNDFYVSKTTEFYLSVKLTSEGDDSWRTVKRTFKPKQKIALSYDEILSIAGITDKFAWSGKNISIKIAKKLIDGTWSESNVVLCTFIHHGPDFEIETVRRTACSDNVELIVKSERLGTYPEDKFKWAVRGGIGGNVKFKKSIFPNTYKLCYEEDDFISTYLRETPDGLKPWFLQLQSTDYKEAAEKFTTKEFEIAPRAPQITISQYTNAGTEVESGLDPYIRIKIEDLDTYYENGRVPYKVYEVYVENGKNKEDTITEFNNRITTEYNEAELKSKFNNQYSKYSWDITEDSFKRSKFHEWYNGGQNIATRTIKLDEFTPAPKASGQITSQANVLCEKRTELYFYNSGSWRRVDFSESASYPINAPKISTSINDVKYDLSSIKSKATTYNNYSNEFITQSSDFIVFRSSAADHILFFNNSSVTQASASPGTFSTSYLASTKDGKPCLIYYKGRNSFFSYYDEKGNIKGVSLYKQPDSINKIRIDSAHITYVSDNQCYKQCNDAISEEDLYSYFTKDQAVIPSTQFDSDWAKFQEERKKEYAKYLAEKLSYKVSGLKHFTEDKTNGDVVTCTGKLKVQEVDSCYSNVIDYKFQYRKVKFDVKVSTYPSTLSANDGVVKLTLDEGGLAPYIVNDRSLNIGDVVEVSGCGYGEKKIMVKDGKGVEFDYTINIPLPKHTIECKPQTCSGGGGEIVVTCEGNDLKLKSYILKRNGDVYRKINCTSNSDTYTFAELDLGDYEVCGEFDNGDQILLSEKATIVDKSLSVTAVVDNATKIGEKGKIELTTQNAQGNVVWQEITENGEIGIDGKGSSISIKDVSIGRHEYRVSVSQVCSASKTVEVFGPEIYMDVDIEADGDSAYVKIEDIKPQNISNYHFEVNGKQVGNFSNISYDSSKNFKLDLKYQTTPQGEVYTYNIIDQKLNSGTISISDASDKERCSGTDGQLKIVAEDIPENVKCYYQIANVSEGETELTNGTHDVSASIGKKVVYVRQEQTFSKGQINVNIHHDSQYSVNIADGTPTDAIVIAHDVKCNGGNDGYIEILTENGELPQNVWLKISTNVSSENITLIPDLIAGIYECYVIDGRCPTFAQKHITTIEEPTNPLQVSIPDNGITNPTCANNDGKIVLKASGGWDDYLAYTRKLTAEEYENALDTTDIEKNLRIEGLEFGNHTIYVHDGGGCVVAVEAELKQYYSPQIINTTAIPARCYGSADGEIVINAVTVDCSVEDKPLSLLFEGRSDTLILTNPYKKTTIKDLSKGYYTLRVSDANECKSDEITVHISQPEPLKVEARLLDEGRIQYNGGSDGRMEITVSGGNVGIDSVFYNNSNVLVSTGVPYIVEGMSEGPIEISAKDEKGCPSNDTTLTFIEPKEPITIETESQAALCHAQTGSVKVTATGGWGDHIIRLVGERESRNSGEQSETTFESLYAGDYEIEVEDKHGAKATQTVRVDAPEPISHEFAMTPDHCDGNGGGMIELSGGTGDYVSLFNMGADSIHGNRILVGNLVGGREYTLTTWDANRCESRMTFTMPDEQLRAEIKYAYNANGSATLTAEVKGGIAPYTYKWRNVSGGEELGASSTQTVTKSGIYRLEIADASGCSYKTMQDVLMAGSIVMRVKSVTRATNPENNNGTASIICKATQAVNLKLYHLETDTWTSSITMQDETTIKLEGLRPGHYSVEGELGDGSKQMAQFYIAPYEPMEVTKLDVKHVSAPGRSDARVVVDFVGGIAPYTVNDTATYETSHIELTNLAAGSIALSVADSTGNVLTKDVEILEPEPLVVTPSRVDSASCFSYSDGSVQLTAIGGWPGYQFANGNGDYRNSAYFGELNAGERTFKVVDKYGVEDSVKVMVGEPDMLRASVAAIDSVSCKGLNDGAAHFAVTGGTAPYRTIYEKETLDGIDVAHLLSGSYVMKFTDSHNCKSPDTISIYIPEPDLLELANDYVTHTTCELDNGKIAIEVKGGSLPYRYEWKENGATYGGAKTVNMVRSEAENLKQNGLYHIDITDLHGCHTQYEMRIEHSENPRVMGVATTDVLCYGSSDGIAEVDSSQVKWGYPKVNYHLTWPQGQTGVMSVNTLPAGTHTVRITDDNHCTTTREFTVGTPEPVKNHLASVRDALCYGYSDGRIETHTTGGVGDYTYVWNTGETTSYADSLKAGLYTIVVTDSHECIDSATYEVGEPEELKVNLGNDVLICPGNIHVFDAGEYATYSWRHAALGEEIATERYLATGDEGDYAIKVTDEIGCIARDTVNITIGENALEANFLMASDAAVNDTIMLVELSNLPVDSVRWEYEPLTFVDIDDAESYMLNLSAENTGRYYITMWAYSGGCESFEQKFIDIYEAVADTSDFKIGYDPLIKQAKVSPNPNDGEFDLIVVLRETYDIDVTVYDVNNGRQVEHVVLKDSDRYNTRLNIRQWGSGIFVLSVSSGTERRAIKVLCVR